MAYTPVSQRGVVSKGGYVPVAQRAKQPTTTTPTTTPTIGLAPQKSMAFKVGAGVSDTLTPDEILNAQKMGVLPAGPLNATGLDANKVRKAIATRGETPPGSSAFGRTDTFGAKALDLLTIPIRWTAGSLATLMVKAGLEKTNSSLTYTPKSRAEELLIGNEDIKKLSDEGFSYGFKTTKDVARKIGLPENIANSSAWLSTLVLGGIIENPLLLGTGKTLTGGAKALQEIVEKEIGRKLSKEEAELLVKDVATIGKIVGKDERLNAVNDVIARFKKDVEPTIKLPTQTTGNDVVERVTKALKEAGISRKEQEAIYKEERGKRFTKARAAGEGKTGVESLKAELGALSGEFEKADFVTLRNKISDDDITTLFDMVKNHPDLSYLESLNARKGLMKMFGEFGGRVPTEGEIALLRRVFPENFIVEMQNKISLWAKAKNIGLEIANIPRSIMSSIDFSAPLRQGAFMIGRKQFWSSLGDMFRAFGSETKFEEVYKYIDSLPHRDLMDEYGLAVTDVGKEIGSREERFASNYAELITGGRKYSPVRASARAYTAFLNKLRADIFEDLLQKAAKAGLQPETDPVLLKSLVDFINAGTGRGKIPKQMAGSAQALNSIFFSPRLLFSRLHLLNPVAYVKMDPFVRKEALKSLFTFTGAILAVLGVAKAGGADVETDPRSSDFAKIKIGNTRVDIAAGFQQYIRAAAQLISGEKKSTTTGEVQKLGEKYGSATRLDIITQFFEAKEAPILSFITTLLKGKDFAGQPIDIKKEVYSRFVPMLITDIRELAEEDPTLLPLGIPALFGVSLQTYLNNTKTKTLPQIPKLPSLPKLPKLPKLP